jgi:CelD/BcsL family acetyltransferase involved in cellulose biosynthesis
MTALVRAEAPSRALTVRRETGESCASLFDDRWDDLLRRQPVPNPTLSATWLQHLLSRETGRPLAIVVEHNDVVVGAGAFGLYRPFRAGPTFARWLGDHRLWFSPELLVDPATPTAGEAVMDALLGVADVAHLPAPEHGAASSALRARVPWSTEVMAAEGWVTRLPPPRLGSAFKKFGKDCRRAGRRGAAVSVRLAASPDGVAAALERLFVMHAERWRTRGGEIPGFSTTERHRAWYRDVVSSLAERGEVRIAEVLEDGEPFAIEMGLLLGRGALLHTKATRLGGKLEQPGRVPALSLLAAFEKAGVHTVDLGWGAGEPEGPKASIGPTRVIVNRILAAGSPRSQSFIEAALSLRAFARKRASKPA